MSAARTRSDKPTRSTLQPTTTQHGSAEPWPRAWGGKDWLRPLAEGDGEFEKRGVSARMVEKQIGLGLCFKTVSQLLPLL
jgi:hypothetical protein